jgi:hypothetical protein
MEVSPLCKCCAIQSAQEVEVELCTLGGA